MQPDLRPVQQLRQNSEWLPDGTHQSQVRDRLPVWKPGRDHQILSVERDIYARLSKHMLLVPSEQLYSNWISEVPYIAEVRPLYCQNVSRIMIDEDISRSVYLNVEPMCKI